MTSLLPFLYIVLLQGNIYIADYNNNRVRKITVSLGIITTYAGTGTGSYSGDNGLATSATLNTPSGISIGNAFLIVIICLILILISLFPSDSTDMYLYIADTQNNRIRKVTASTGIISTIAGTGTASYSGDNGQATSAGLNMPLGVAVDSSGSIFSSFILVPWLC